jgi:hypothetical protein
VSLILPSPSAKWDAQSQAQAHQILMQADAQNLKRGGAAELASLIVTGVAEFRNTIKVGATGEQGIISYTSDTGMGEAGMTVKALANKSLALGANNTNKFIIEADGDMAWGTFGTEGRTSRLVSTASISLRFDDNTIQDHLVLTNADGASTSFGSRIVFKRGTAQNDSAPTEAGAIRMAGEQVWTSTASTRDGVMIFYVAVDNVSTEKLRIGTSSVRASAHIDFGTNNTYDIGTSGNHPHNIYLAGQLDCSNAGQFDINSAVGTSAPIRFNREGGTGGIALYQGNTTTIVFSVDNSGIVNAAGHYRVDGTQVVSNRVTGWSAATTTVNRAAVTNATTLANLAQAVGTLINDLRTHGLIGT